MPTWRSWALRLMPAHNGARCAIWARAVREASTLFSFGHAGAYDHEDDARICRSGADR